MNMKAVVCTQYGPPEVLQIQEVSKPVPKDHQILVKIAATAVNSGDVRVRGLDVEGILKVIMRLVIGFSKPRQPILGTVFSGTVETVGAKVSAFKVGDKVFGMTGFKFGTYAEYIAVNHDSNVMEMPGNASFEEAVAIIFGGQTAIHYLQAAKIAERSKPKVLIIGATGSVGTAAVQIARHYHAAVTAICSSNGEQLLRSLGIQNILRYDKEDVSQHTEKYDIIFDAVGKYKKSQFKHLAKEGGVYKSVSSGYASESLEQLKLLKDLFEKGVLDATIDKTYPLNDIVEAHRYVDTGRKKGNVVIGLEV
jgi:NADPH:quinone reductase-like Zn-dependent oxidoreductase